MARRASLARFSGVYGQIGGWRGSPPWLTLPAWVYLRNISVSCGTCGLFTPDQFFKASDTPMDPQKPARGIIEVKGTNDDAWIVANGEQVSRYWGKYRQFWLQT